MRDPFEIIVRCARGHLFRSIWVSMVSFKAVRLGAIGAQVRFEHCPVGHHWGIVRPVDQDALSPEELAEARAHHDVHIP